MQFHEIAAVFPLFSQQNLQELADDITAYGQRHPVVLFEGKILDGRNRFNACELAQVEPKFVQFKGDWEQAVALVASENLRRRNLTDSQRALAAGKLAHLSKGRPRKDDEDGAKNTSRDVFSQAEAARQLNVGVAQVQRARQVLIKGAPELVDAVEAGTVPVKTAAELTKLPIDVQQATLTEGPEAVRAAAAAVRRQRTVKAGPVETSTKATTHKAEVDAALFGMADQLNALNQALDYLEREAPYVFTTDLGIFAVTAAGLRDIVKRISGLTGANRSDSWLDVPRDELGDA